MKSWKQTLFVVLVALTILSLILSACEPIDRSKGNGNAGNDQDKDKEKDKDKAKDQQTDTTGRVDKISICHRTGSAKKPYVQISVPDEALKNGHGTHAGDLIPAPEGGCPDTVPPTEVPAK